MRATGPAPVAAVLLLGAVVAGSFMIVGRPIEVVSRSADGTPADQQVAVDAISSNGRFIVFETSASNLVDATAGKVSAQNVYAADRLTGSVRLVSVTPSGAPGSGFGGSVSADGRFVAFFSASNDLVANDRNPSGSDVFVRDLETGQTERVPMDPISPEVYRTNTQPALSADGNLVAFSSSATSLASGVPTQICLYDRTTHAITLVSPTHDGRAPDGGSVMPAVSADGRIIAFSSNATNLIPGDGNGKYDVVVRDLRTATTERVSVATDGTEADADCWAPAVSADGRFVVFWSEATSLVPDDTNRVADVFLRDRQAGTTERVSVSSSGAQGDRASPHPASPWSVAVSADGRFIAFGSEATNLVPNDVGGFDDVFVRDRALGTTVLVSVTIDGIQGDWHSGAPVLTPDARSIAFSSEAPNLTGPQRIVTSQALVRTIGCDTGPAQPWEHCPTTTTSTAPSTTAATAPVTTTTTSTTMPGLPATAGLAVIGPRRRMLRVSCALAHPDGTRGGRCVAFGSAVIDPGQSPRAVTKRVARRLNGHGFASIALPLNAAGRKALRRNGRLHVVVEIMVRDRSGHSVVLEQAIDVGS